MIGFRGWDDFTPKEFPPSGWLRVTDVSGVVVHYAKIASAYKFDNDRLKLNLSPESDDKLISGSTISGDYVFEVIGVFTET